MASLSPTLEETRKALADEWERRDPVGDDGIAAFYRDSECLAADLDAWHATPERQAWTRDIVAVAGANRVESVLDVGAGVGHDVRALIAEFPHLGCNVVEPNQALRDAMPARVLPYAHLAEATGEYDLVLCIDVLEHVTEPEALLTEIMARVKDGGLLVEATATHDQSTPLHLPEHAEWEPGAILRTNGFQAVEQMNRMVVWQKTGVIEIETDTATAIVVAHREIAAPTVECLLNLYGKGWPVMLPYGDALIDRARAKAVSAWYLNETTDVFLMIDDDIVFKAEDAERVVELAREKRAIACGAYPVGGGGHLASRGWPGTLLEFGPDKEPIEIRWPATGFMAVHRDVVTALIESLGEPCYPDKPDRFWPMFQPYKLGPDYLSEDYAFGQRALDLGFKTWLDPKTILIHLKIKGLSVLNMPGAEVK